jgi:internalin A
MSGRQILAVVAIVVILVGTVGLFVWGVIDRRRANAGVDAETAARLRSDPNRAGEDKSAAAVTRLGGTVVRIPPGDESLPVGEIILTDRPVTDADAAELAGLVNATHLHLAGTKITDDGVRALKPLRMVNILDLSRTAVTGATLGELKDYYVLRQLHLAKTRTNDAGLAAVGNFYALESLDLSDTAVTDAGLLHLKKLSRLTRIDLARTKATAAGVRAIATPRLSQVNLAGVPMTVDEFMAVSRSRDPHPADGGQPLADITVLRVSGVAPQVTDHWLEVLANQRELALLVDDVSLTGAKDGLGLKVQGNKLNLAGSRVTDAGLKFLDDPDAFTALGLADTAVTDAGLANLPASEELKDLDLSRTKVTDAGLRHLKKFPALRQIYLSGTAVTDAGAADLQAALPDCTINR